MADRQPLLKRAPWAEDPNGLLPPSRIRRRRRPSTFLRFISIALPITLLYCAYKILSAVPLSEFSLACPRTWLETFRLPHPNWPLEDIPLEELEKIAITYPKADRAKEWSRYYTSGPHLGGKNYSQALWTKERLEELGFETRIEEYAIYVNYPLGHRLALLKTSKHGDGFDVEYEAKLEEPVLEKDTTSGLKDRIPTFHGYSASGNVTGPLLFANYGTYSDYDTLLAHNITIAGTVVLVKYGGIFRGLKVKRAQELGAAGVIMYSDPGDDSRITPQEGYEEYPEGPARHRDSVQRGSTMFLSYGPGDPTTPGYPSLPESPRQDPYKLIPKIPSIPISYADALPLLLALNSHGPLAKDLGWDQVNLYNEQNYTITPMWNVIATLPGTLGGTEGIVVAGNHRDAWIAGGAGDPNSGSAALIEVAGALAEMRKKGWTPIRDIVLASWDGEEYGLLGSTEWVEDHAKYLTENAVAYINLDVGTVGTQFLMSANPLLFGLAHESANKVPIGDPREGKTIGNTWNGDISTLGSGSDYTAFQDFLGIPSTDMAFKNDVQDAVWMYHSNYDSFSWMEMFGDRGFVRHEAIARMWTMMLLHLASRDVLPLNVTEYAVQLEKYIGDFQGSEKVKGVLSLEEFSAGGASQLQNMAVHGNKVNLDVYGNPTAFRYGEMGSMRQGRHHDHSSLPKEEHFCIKPLPKVFSSLTKAALDFSRKLDSLVSAKRVWTSSNPDAPIPSIWNYIPRLLLWRQISAANKALRTFDRAFLSEQGLLKEREWYKHVVFAPGRWTGYAGVVLPGLGEAWEDADLERWRRAKEALKKCGEAAREVLRGVKFWCE
ncbi:hypothetical protein BDZ91DRAFT_732558 [Kalaharituber pfeilii]|nr:hypothetical protein BDZ91DRAFT_732558 [Kalaharituber pfeilii]